MSLEPRDGVRAARYYQFALYIAQEHRFCYEHRFYNAPFQWRHGIRKPKDRTEELGDRAKEWRENRLPSPAAYSALAHVFRNAETFTDQLMSAVSAICCSVPIRAYEVLQLRESCEVRERAMLKRIGPDGVEHEEEGEVYGIQVWPGKGNPPQVKWVPTVMVSVVQEAVQRLRDLCRPARNIAAGYKAHCTLFTQRALSGSISDKYSFNINELCIIYKNLLHTTVLIGPDHPALPGPGISHMQRPGRKAGTLAFSPPAISPPADPAPHTRAMPDWRGRSSWPYACPDSGSILVPRSDAIRIGP